MTLIDGDKIVTAHLYDDGMEEFIEKKMSIIEFVNAYSDEGVTTADDVLDKIKAEIIEDCGYSKDYFGAFTYSTIRLKTVLRIIDKYKAENEPQESEVENGTN